MPSCGWTWTYGASSGSFCCWPLHTYTYEVDTGTRLSCCAHRPGPPSSTHGRYGAPPTVGVTVPAAGRHSHSGFRRNRACQQAQFLFCAVLTVPPRHGPVPLAGLCWLAWPVSELGGNGSSANTEQRGSRVNTYTCEHFGWFQDFCFGLWS